MTSTYLFVYGTLLKDTGNDMASFLHAHSECLGNGYFHGKLYRISWYPGAVLSENTSENVHGKIFKIHDAAVFKVLDDYEGTGINYPEPHLFKKEQVTAFLEDGATIETVVYLYNLPLDGLQQIKSGDFLKHVSDS
ncbi:gamma-glutamylcyclotransferase family protein [Tamlana crocina]